MEKIELIKRNGYYTINLPDEKYRGKGVFYTTVVNAPVYNTEPFQNIYKDFTIHFTSTKDNSGWRPNIAPAFKTDSKGKTIGVYTTIYDIAFPGQNQPTRDFFCWMEDLDPLQKILLAKAIENFNNDSKNNFLSYPIQVRINQTIELTGKYAEIARAFSKFSYPREHISHEDWEDFLAYIRQKTGVPLLTDTNIDKKEKVIDTICDEGWFELLTFSDDD